VLAVGDRVVIPEKEAKQLIVATGAKHTFKTLIVETAKELASKRPGASVSYDNATFTQADGKPGLSWFQIQPYAIAKNAPNLIARPMHRLDKTKAQKSEIAKSISIAFDTGPNGGGITADTLQIMIDWTHASGPRRHLQDGPVPKQGGSGDLQPRHVLSQQSPPRLPRIPTPNSW
jgi:hypothetical protein